MLAEYSADDGVLSQLRTLGRVMRARYRPHQQVLFYPDPPCRSSVLWKVLTRMGIGITTDPSDPAIAAILWRDETVVNCEYHAAALDRFPRILNVRCSDISKSHVGTCFAEVFGYDLAVDPLQHTGPMVVKSEENATHDGHLRIGPLARRDPTMAYQHLVGSMVTARLCVDYRIPIIDGRIPLAHLRFRRHVGRFVSEFSKVLLVDVDDVLSDDEQDRILRFAERMGLDYGELDVLRDRRDGRIYVVDCNKTPWGPALQMPRRDRVRALERMIPYVAAMIGADNSFSRPDSGGPGGDRDGSGTPVYEEVPSHARSSPA
jgi:hypothetical protein